MARPRFRHFAALALLGLACAAPTPPSTPTAPSGAVPSFEAEAADLLSAYLQLDTTNPPGNEALAAAFLRDFFADVGLEAQTFESAPGRENLVVRLRGDGTGAPIILMHHTDVVAADPDYWDQDPFGGAQVDGYVWGRGALDTKGHGLAQALAMRELVRDEVPLDRDIVFLAVADEEAGGAAGAGFMVEHHFELFEGAALVMNEGGAIQADDAGRAIVWGVEAAQKVPFWLRLRARGTPGHGSQPRVDNAPVRLVRALTRIADSETPLRVLPRVQRFYAETAHLAPPEQRALWKDLETALHDPENARRFTADIRQNASVRNTISLTALEGSPKTNVIPPEATAELDIRLLPDQDPEAFLEELRAVIDDPEIEIEKLLSFPPAASPIDHPFFDTLRALAARHDPDAFVTATMAVGFTDCHFFRERGIPCYGFAPFRIPPELRDGIHGNNERISIQDFARGVRITTELLRALAEKSE